MASLFCIQPETRPVAAHVIDVIADRFAETPQFDNSPADRPDDGWPNADQDLSPTPMHPPSVRCDYSVDTLFLFRLEERHDEEHSRPRDGEHDGSDHSKEVNLSASVRSSPPVNESQCCPDHAKNVDDASPEKSQNRIGELILSAHG